MREVLGRRARLGDAVRRRSTTPSALTVVLDAAMMDHDTLNFHPLVNTMTTSIGREDLVNSSSRPAIAPRIERDFRAQCRRAS